MGWLGVVASGGRNMGWRLGREVGSVRSGGRKEKKKKMKGRRVTVTCVCSERRKRWSKLGRWMGLLVAGQVRWKKKEI